MMTSPVPSRFHFSHLSLVVNIVVMMSVIIRVVFVSVAVAEERRWKVYYRLHFWIAQRMYRRRNIWCESSRDTRNQLRRRDRGELGGVIDFFFFFFFSFDLNSRPVSKSFDVHSPPPLLISPRRRQKVVGPHHLLGILLHIHPSIWWPYGRA